MKKLTLHIGYNKTGTSAIQTFLDRNRQPLIETGLHYPRTGIFDSAHYGISEFFIGRPVKTGVNTGQVLINALRDEIASSGCDNVILSSEYFTTANPDHIARVRKAIAEFAPDYQMQVIIYLRRHDLWFESLFNQAEKTAPAPPWQMDIRDFVLHVLGTASPECSYLRVVDRWARTFGDANVIVRPFEEDQFSGGTLVADFFHALGQELPDGLAVADAKSNESLSAEALYAIGVMKRCLAGSAVSKLMPQLIRSERNAAAKLVPADYGKLSAVHRYSLYMFFLPEYNAIARRFMGRTREGLFQEVPQRPQ